MSAITLINQSPHYHGDRTAAHVERKNTCGQAHVPIVRCYWMRSNVIVGLIEQNLISAV